MAKKTKEIVFSSERMERRRNARRYWIPAVTLVVMIGAAAAVALLTRSDRGGTYAGEGTPFSYSWTEEKNGCVTLELDRSGVDGYLWVVSDASAEVVVREADGTEARPNESGEPTVLTVEPDKKQPKDKLRLVMKPESAGRAMFTMSLLNESDPTDRIGELSVLAETRNDGGKLNVYLISAGGKKHQGVIRGEGTEYAYVAQMNEYDNFVLTVVNKLAALEENELEADEETELTEDQGGEEEEVLFYGYTEEEFMALPDEERIALLEKEQARLDALEAEEDAAEEQQEPEGWRCVSDNEDVTEVLDIVYASESVSAYLLPGGQPGSATVKMTDPDSGTEITLICEVDANGDFRVTSHSINQ